MFRKLSSHLNRTLTRPLKALHAFMEDETGSNMGEYAAIGALVLLVALGAFMALGSRISSLIESIAGAI